VAFVATPQPLNDPPRVMLELTGASGSSATITRRDPDGRVRPVRLGDPAALSGGAWTGYDYESWFGRPTVWEATTAPGIVQATAAVTLDVTEVWLRHPGVPALSVRLEIAGEPEATYALNRALLAPQGRTFPIVYTDGRRKAKTSTMQVYTWSLDESAALLGVLSDGQVVLLDVPSSLRWGIEHQYMAVADLTESRSAPEVAEFGGRTWSLPYDVVDQPAGGQQAQWTWDDLVAAYATWDDVVAAYATWGDVLANRPRTTPVPVPVPGGASDGTVGASVTETV
jgi:hypothetical protein